MGKQESLADIPTLTPRWELGLVKLQAKTGPEKYVGQMLGENNVPPKELERARVIGTLLDNKGRVVSVQDPSRSLNLGTSRKPRK